MVKNFKEISEMVSEYAIAYGWDYALLVIENWDESTGDANDVYILGDKIANEFYLDCFWDDDFLEEFIDHFDLDDSFYNNEEFKEYVIENFALGIFGFVLSYTGDTELDTLIVKDLGDKVFKFV